MQKEHINTIHKSRFMRAKTQIPNGTGKRILKTILYIQCSEFTPRQGFFN